VRPPRVPTRRLQETCLKGEELVGKVQDLAGGLQAGGGGARHAHRLEGIELMIRQLKAYCAAF